MAYRVLLLTSPMQRGADVAALQQVIKFYDPAPGGAPFVDGVFGPNTRDALLAYQRESGLGRNAAGIATPDFQRQLRLPEPGTPAGGAAPTVQVESAPPGAALVAMPGPGKPTNWKLWLSLAGLVGLGYLATKQKGRFF